MFGNHITAVANRQLRAGPSGPDPWRPGIILRPLVIEGRLRGEAGQAVRYRDTGAGVDVVVGVCHLAREVPAEWVIARHPDYSPSRVYLMLSCKRRVLGTLGADRNDYLLAWNVARQFPDHRLHEDLVLLACELAEACESNGTGRYPHTRFLIAQYLRAYPRGRFRDRLEWTRARLVLRREGQGDPLETLEAFRRFLCTHPRSGRRAEIKLAMARLCRIASQWLFANGGCPVRADRCLRRARHLYRGLVDHPDLEVSQAARVALFELEERDQSQEVTRDRPVAHPC